MNIAMELDSFYDSSWVDPKKFDERGNILNEPRCYLDGRV